MTPTTLSAHLHASSRVAALMAIFLIAFGGTHQIQAVTASECEDTFLGCIEEDDCGDGAGCTFGECEGTVECMDGPGCEDGETAIICRFGDT